MSGLKTSGRRVRLAPVLLLATLVAPSTLSAAAGPAATPSSLVRQAAAAVPVGGQLRLEGVEADDRNGSETLALERFEVFAPDAEITIHGKGGRTTVEKAPANVYFRGAVEGDPDSRVFLSVQADGQTLGVVSRHGDTYLIGGDEASARSAGGALVLQRVDPFALDNPGPEGGFACGNSKLGRNDSPFKAVMAGDDTYADLVAKAETAGLPGFTARVAIETDAEFYNLFNNSTNATNYIGNLLGYASTIYIGQINTSLLVSSVSLWTGGVASDPWTQFDTFCGLMEFGKYWNVNRTGVSRTIAHLMSGKPLGGGIAWVGVLCQSSFNTGAAASCSALGAESTPWGGAYGFTAGLSGTFNVNAPTVMWDIVAVSHEIGHNFNSPHTHCYNGLEGNANPIDQCRSGEVDSHGACYSGAQTLPGASGTGSGTIMSYCHLLGGGFGNISMNFGSGHNFGVTPGREATRMTNHVIARAAANPACLVYTAGSGSPAPTVAAIAPLSGLTTGGTPVTITGTNFVSGATVTFDTGANSANATGVVVVNGTTVTATAPAHATGVVRVTVTNPDSQSGFRDNAFFYTPAPVASGFYTVTPCRVIDTRNAAGPRGGPALQANAARTFTVTGVCGIPAGAKAISANVTVVAQAGSGSFTFYPGNAFPLGTNNLSFPAGANRAGASILSLSTNGTGTIGVTNFSAVNNHLILDVNGYFQ